MAAHPFVFGEPMKLKRESLLLYLVTDSRFSKNMPFEQAVEQAIKGGVTILQFREKHLHLKERIPLAEKIGALCRSYKIPFIINDDPNLAKKLNADGVHLGQEDMPIKQARQILGDDKIIGVSAHTVAEAEKAFESGADYLGVGAVFGSNTKTDTINLTPELLGEIAGSVPIPCVAIGGVNENNIHLLNNTGISGVAVVSGILAKENPLSAAKKLKELAGEAVYGK